MSSSESTFPLFKQDEYHNNFYYCTGRDKSGEDTHIFIVFTTCYCPLCEGQKYINKMEEEVTEAELRLDLVEEMYQDLVIKVRNHSPELLI